MTFHLCRAQGSQADVSSSPAELKISSKFLVVQEEGVLSLLLVGSVLLTLSLRDTSWMLTLYNSPKQSVSSSYNVLTAFSLPLVSGVAQTDSKGSTGKRRSPVLICVHSSDTTPPSSSSSPPLETTLTDSHFRLESVLFRLLFGIDAALAKSPVVLCALPDGCLYFLPVRLPAAQLRALHSLEQPVVFVGTSSVMETGLGHPHSLVAVGELGRVVQIKTNKEQQEGGGSTAAFIERFVPGPVISVCVDKNSLYYSTGSDLLRLDLSLGSSERESQEREGKASSKTDTSLQSPTSLNVCRLVALAEPACSTAGKQSQAQHRVVNLTNSDPEAVSSL